MREEEEIFSPGAQNGIRIILTEAGFKEHTDFFFSNGLVFYNQNTQIAQMDAIAEYFKNVCTDEDLE